MLENLYGKHAAALYAQAADFNKTARFYYMKAEDAYYLANAQASYDDWRRLAGSGTTSTAESKRLGTIIGELGENIRSNGEDMLWIIGPCISDAFRSCAFRFSECQITFPDTLWKWIESGHRILRSCAQKSLRNLDSNQKFIRPHIDGVLGDPEACRLDRT
eukprot:CAMPEP_0172198534 /NCGR_PEP_ID=MMETSP1050-20130122/28145_1 /TAXON_ID=233186 /ORGANISM="Cryptomonas curvata, Strain CCAP979/52" /LENGTH=160 /DNA_ID=CAMNT_0012875375 /DNA_START=156 /DNA_END=639 /DNA_ORIENTATION=+